MKQISPSASAYMAELTHHILSVEVTDRHLKKLSLDEGAERAVDMLLALPSSSKVMLVGNGGSAAIASHAHNDVCKAVGMKGLVFTEQPLLTAIANDDGYESVYERPIRLWAEAGDLAVIISSSGRSTNILRAAEAAQDRKCRLMTLSGFQADNPLRALGDLNFYVGSSHYGYVETTHAAVMHLITDLAKARKQEKHG